MIVTGFYAGLLGIFYIWLSVNVIRWRMKKKISIGAGGDDELTRRMRMHGNFAEYVPISLILLAVLETHGHAPYLIHFLGAMLAAGRFSHAYSIAVSKIRFRQIGMMLTFAFLGVASVLAIAGIF